MSRLILALLALGIVVPAVAAEALQSIVTTQTTAMTNSYWAVPKTKASGDPAILYLSADMGQTWDATVPLPTNMIEPPAITGVAYSWDYIYVATDGEGVFRTDDGRGWEKWNDADVSIQYITGSVGEPVSVITEHGATFIKTADQFHNTFVQQYDVPLTATAISIDGSMLIGASTGNIFTFMNGELFDTTDGNSGRPGPLPGAVRDILQLPDWRVYVVEDSEGQNRVYTKPGYSLVGGFKRLNVDGAPLYIAAIARAYDGLAVVTAGDLQRLLYTCDNGESWTEIPLPIPSGVNSFVYEFGGCGSPNSHSHVRIATDDGGFFTDDEGAAWTAYGDTSSERTGSVRIADSDLGVQMISPSAINGGIMNTTSRFEIEVTNHGPERVEDIRVGLDFVTWRNGNTQGSSSYGTSVAINGIECSRDVDWLLFPHMTVQCELDALEPGESARIVWIHGLPDDAFSMRLEAKVDSHKLRDSHPNNDRLDFSPSVRSIDDIPNGSGGGGSTGVLWVLVMLLCGRRHRI